MPIQSNIFNLLSQLWEHFSLSRKKQFVILLILMALVSIAEIVSIGSIFPFLGALTNPNEIYNSPRIKPIFEVFGIHSSSHILLAVTVIFGLAAIVAGTLRLLLLKLSLQISFATGADIGFNIYRRTLYQSYETHLSRNTSEVIDGITGKTTIVTDGIIMSSLYILSSLVMLVFVIGALIFIAPIATLSAFVLFSLLYLIVIKITQRRVLEHSKTISKESSRVIRSLQEGLGGIRDVLLDGSQEIYCKTYRDSDTKLRMAYAGSSFISSSPRFAMESLGMLLIAFLAYSIAQQPGGLNKAIPTIGALALAAQRMLPVMQTAYNSWTQIRRNQFSLAEIINYLNQSEPDNKRVDLVDQLNFNESIVLSNVSFKYKNIEKEIIQNVDIEIKKGSVVGFIGQTGSGKSTLLDIIMGLLEPTAGSLNVDGQIINRSNVRSWQNRLTHVPQHIFLTDTSIAENIALGTPINEIDFGRVQNAAALAQISSTIESWPEQYHTQVGERGIRLSGGQRQRIGIARALYKQADVLILDEATSALDSETEDKVMNAANELGRNKTLIIIAHRISTLKRCDRIYELKNGELSHAGTYSDIIGNQNLK